jgi:hypothetical protein
MIDAYVIAHAAVRDFDPSRYPDQYTAAVAQLRIIREKRDLARLIDQLRSHTQID